MDSEQWKQIDKLLHAVLEQRTRRARRLSATSVRG